MRPGSAALAVLLAAAVWAGMSRAGTGATCTFAQRAKYEAAADAYAKKIPAERAAYFGAHTSASRRRAFVAKQKATLATLRKAAACDDSVGGSGTTDSGPVAAPPPGPNEKFVFGDEMSATARDELEGDVAYAVQDEQALLGVQLTEVNVFASSNAAWLAQQECGFYGYGSDCVAQKQTSYGAGAAEGGDRSIAIFAGSGWSSSSPAERQKTLGHELFHVFQYQLDGLTQDGSTPLDQVRQSGPVWIHEGSAEVVGYRVLGDRRLNFSSYTASLATAKTRAKPVTIPLDQLQTVVQDRAAGNPYAVYMVAVDHLLSITPNGIKALSAYYQDLGAGQAWPDAFASAFGMPVDAFYSDFAAYRSHL